MNEIKNNASQSLHLLLQHVTKQKESFANKHLINNTNDDNIFQMLTTIAMP